MKKISLFLALVLLAMISIALLTWTNRENIFAHFLSRQLHVPVSLRSLDIQKRGATLEKIWVGVPPHSQSTTSFAAETTTIETSFSELIGNPLIIDAIEIDNIFVGIEFYDAKGTTSNWQVILREDTPKHSTRNYLIKTLILRDLTVEVIDSNGNVKRYPTIPSMEFHNISSETGFPIDEIEKAIFNLMMRNIFQTLPIDKLFKTFLPPWAVP